MPIHLSATLVFIPTVNMNYFCNKKHIFLYRAARINPNKICYLSFFSYLLKYGFKKLQHQPLFSPLPTPAIWIHLNWGLYGHPSWFLLGRGRSVFAFLVRTGRTPQFKSINSSALSLLHSPTLTSIHDHRKNHSLD